MAVSGLRRGVGLLSETYQKWNDDKAPRLAAALAYYSVFSLAPLLMIAAGLAGMFFGEVEARQRILDQVAAVVGHRAAEAVRTMMGRPDEATQAGLISTIAGFATLLIGAVAVLAQLKDALNSVWDVTARKLTWVGMGRYYVANFALVIATGFLLLVSLIATAALGVFTAAARGYVAGPPWLWFILDSALGFLMTAAVFTLVFRVIPDAPVRWGDAAAGGAFTALLFTVGRVALGLYLGREAGDSAYEAAGSVLALLAWVYYSAQLVLFGAEFTHIWAGRREAAEAARA